MATELVERITEPAQAGAGLHELRPYQREAGRAVLASVSNGLGHAITIEMARQGGKNELSAQVELLLLLRCAHRAQDAVKCAPTFMPQLRLSMRRLWRHPQPSPRRGQPRRRGSGGGVPPLA